MGGSIILLICMIWWVYIYSPVRMDINRAREQYEVLIQKKAHLEARISNLEKKRKENMIQEAEMKAFSDLLVHGKNLEEVNAVVQQMVQGFLEKNDTIIKTYQVLKPSKWMDYELGMLQFSIRASHRGLADLLKFFENMKQLVRLEQININYNRGRDYNLLINFKLATLFVDDGNKGPDKEGQ